MNEVVPSKHESVVRVFCRDLSSATRTLKVAVKAQDPEATRQRTTKEMKSPAPPYGIYINRNPDDEYPRSLDEKQTAGPGGILHFVPTTKETNCKSYWYCTVPGTAV
jgi:hypothetical protein